jgi:hypothetical protein
VAAFPSESWPDSAGIRKYVGSIKEWKRITGKENRFVYDRGQKLNEEVYR